MREPQIDYAAVFQALPGMVALLTPDLVYVDANDDFLRLSGRTREQLLGRYIFDVFPENPDDPAATGMRETAGVAAPRGGHRRAGHHGAAPLRRRGTRRPGALAGALLEPGQRPGARPGRQGGAGGAPGGGGHRAHPRPRRPGSGGSRARVAGGRAVHPRPELQEVNERLRRAHAREREVALALQAAMLPAARPGRARTGRPCATGPPSARSTCAATGTTWSTCPATASRSPSATSSATAWRPPASWASCAAR